MLLTLRLRCLEDTTMQYVKVNRTFRTYSTKCQIRVPCPCCTLAWWIGGSPHNLLLTLYLILASDKTGTGSIEKVFYNSDYIKLGRFIYNDCIFPYWEKLTVLYAFVQSNIYPNMLRIYILVYKYRVFFPQSMFLSFYLAKEKGMLCLCLRQCICFNQGFSLENLFFTSFVTIFKLTHTLTHSFIRSVSLYCKSYYHIIFVNYSNIWTI